MTEAGFIRPTIRPDLTALDNTERQDLLRGALDGVSHDVASMDVAALNELALSGFGPPVPPPQRIRVAAWNAQHCHFAEQSGALLARHDFDLVLLTELDVGMRRTGQVDTPKALARAQGHGSGFAMEFLELCSPDGITPQTRLPGGNDLGFHGNGFTAAQIPLDTALIRLTPEADWYHNPRRDQHRIGGRVAVAARFALGAGSFVAVSVHLESDTDSAGRGRQMQQLLDGIEAFAPGEPALIGGDCNTGARQPGFDHSAEQVFGLAEAAGYDWRACNLDRPTSRQSLVTNAVQQSSAHYDWFFSRSLLCTEPQVIAAVDPRGTPLSDHEIISVSVELAT